MISGAVQVKETLEVWEMIEVHLRGWKRDSAVGARRVLEGADDVFVSFTVASSAMVLSLLRPLLVVGESE